MGFCFKFRYLYKFIILKLLKLRVITRLFTFYDRRFQSLVYFNNNYGYYVLLINECI